MQVCIQHQITLVQIASGAHNAVQVEPKWHVLQVGMIGQQWLVLTQWI